MPFGIKGAPAKFQELMTNLLADMVEYASAYLDDITIFGQSWGQHLAHIRKVMDRLREAGLTLKPQKCAFGMTKCEYLGHMVGGGQVEPLEAKIKAIQDYTRPRRKKGLRAFLGLGGYYRKFGQDFSTIAYPLTQMTKNNKWTAEAEQAFEQLKLSLTSGTVLRAPDWCLPFYLQTNASQVGIGAVLSQFQDGVDRPISLYSRKLLPRETRYAAVELECLAVVNAVRHFGIYLATGHFVIQTDHKSLKYLDKCKDENGRLARGPWRYSHWTMISNIGQGLRTTMQTAYQDKRTLLMQP